MEEAENIARNEHGSNKISVISGIYKFSSAENRLLLNFINRRWYSQLLCKTRISARWPVYVKKIDLINISAHFFKHNCKIKKKTFNYQCLGLLFIYSLEIKFF